MVRLSKFHKEKDKAASLTKMSRAKSFDYVFEYSTTRRTCFTKWVKYLSHLEIKHNFKTRKLNTLFCFSCPKWQKACMWKDLKFISPQFLLFVFQHKESKMPAESSRERQSVYEKALLIFRKGEKHLIDINKELEEHKLQKYIDYKLEERKLQKELIGLRQEQARVAKEAFKRHRDHKTIDEIAKELKPDSRAVHLETIKLKNRFSKLPEISCTQRNIPQILRRDLSYESEYYTWTFGLPKNAAGNSAPPLPNGSDQMTSSLRGFKGKRQSGRKIKQNKLRKQNLNVHQIVYSIPLSDAKRSKPSTGNSQFLTLPAIATNESGNTETKTRNVKSKFLKLPSINFY